MIILPLRIASTAGLGAALLALGYGTFVVTKALTLGDPVAGFPTLIAVITFLGGLQLLAIGVLGEYVGRTFLEAKRRPLYLVEAYRRASAAAEPKVTPASEHGARKPRESA